MQQPKCTAEQVIQAIAGTGGIKTDICRRLSISRHTLDSYLDRWPTVAQAYQEECERVLDLAEGNIHQAIREHDMDITRWYLRTRGRERGYGDAMEHSGPGGGPIEHRVTIHRAERPSGNGDSAA